ncbi:MAG: hypothetical protein V4539_03380 [Bacteroidota bacterium]
MRVLKTIKLIWTFYLGFLLYSMLVTGCCLFFFYRYGLGVFTVLFWFKIITLGISYHFVNEYKQREYYYYRNLGVSKFLLWSVTLSFDFVLFIFLIIQAYQFK